MREIRWTHLAIAATCAVSAAALTVHAGPVSVNLEVKVRLVSSSGVCSLTGTTPAVGVNCDPGSGGQIPGSGGTTPGAGGSGTGSGPVAPIPVPSGAPPAESGGLARLEGTTRYQRVGTVLPMEGMREPLEVYSGGVNITSWRVVSLDNGRYVELTIAW